MDLFKTSFFIWMAFIFTNSGCGTSSEPFTYNDPVPSGILVSQGQWTSLNGASVSGTVVVYKTSSVDYVLRLNGISTPKEENLQIVAVVNSKEQSPQFLKSSSGTQNYNYSLEKNAVWNNVYLYSVTNSKDYAHAILTSTSSESFKNF